MRSTKCDWRTTIKLAETLDGKTLDILFKKYSSNHPNTYTLAKSLGEQIVNDYRNKLPVIIYRVAQSKSVVTIQKYVRMISYNKCSFFSPFFVSYAKWSTVLKNPYQAG